MVGQEKKKEEERMKKKFNKGLKALKMEATDECV